MQKSRKTFMENKKKYKYKFTVIMPAYNTEEYIDEAIKSVIKQDIGFKNIQLIIVNDGSPDNLSKIAYKYLSMYPENIFVINKENGGPGSARNTGIEYIEGKYVNFMDSDDRMKKDVLKKVYSFFEKNYNKTDVISVPIVFFDSKNEEHHLNYKYKKGTRIINLKEEWDAPQLQVASCYIKKSTLDLGYRFDERTYFAEDAKFVQQVLSEKQTLGVVSNTSYYYRIRSGANKSIVQLSTNNKKWYIPCIKYSYCELVDFYIKKLGYVPKSVQNTICTDLQWKIKNERIPNKLLDENEKKEYLSLIRYLLTKIDRDIIDYQKYIGKDIKIAMLNLKGEKISKETIDGVPVLTTNSLKIYSEEKDSIISLDFIKSEQNKCLIEGRYTSIFSDTPTLILATNDKEYFAKVEKYKYNSCVLAEKISCTFKFTINFPMQEECEYTFCIKYNDRIFLVKNILYGQYFPLSLELSKMYSHIGDYILFRDSLVLNIKKYNKLKHFFFEFAFLVELIKYKNQNNLYKAIKKAVFVRFLFNIKKLFKKKNIWLFRDRTNVADDNGIVLFNYVNKHAKEIKSIFAISRKSKEYKAIKKEGRVIDAQSWKYKVLYLMSDYVFSSSGDNDAIRPFSDHNEPYKDIEQNIKIIFLQHGVIKDDLSQWLNKYKMNFAGFVCSAKKEKQSILNQDYGYSSNEVWLTGLPRYDNLFNNKEKIIAITPTWRSYLVGDKMADDSRGIVSEYSKSNYYFTYNSLLNDRRLASALKNKGYKLIFYAHPNLKGLSIKFENKNEYLIEPEIKYLDLFSKASLLITDYSSVAFDFAYLKKPVLYFQFDEEEFFKKHIVYDKGYFSYKEDGFGEIEYHIDGLVDRITEYLEDDCKMKEIYKNRVQNFFEYSDRKNCERILNMVYKTVLDNK